MIVLPIIKRMAAGLAALTLLIPAAAHAQSAIPGALDQYNEIWITQEPEGGSAVPTAPHYLEGPLSQ